MGRPRKAPRRYDDHNETTNVYQSPADFYRQQYYEVVDSTINCIQSRFTQTGMSAHINLEDLILKTSQNIEAEDCLIKIRSTYKEDFDYQVLSTELEMLSLANRPFNNSTEFIDWLRLYKATYPQLCHVARLILLMPASNAASERSFSAMARVHSSIRSSMGQSRLNSLLLLHVHTDITDKLDIDSVIDDFVSCHPRRQLQISRCV